MSKPRPVKTTQTSLDLIREIQSMDGASLTELSNRLNVAKSTVHNHLATLTEEGFLVRDENSYYVGLEFLAFGEHARNRSPLYAPARRTVHTLAKQTNLEVDFIVEENGRVYSLEYVIGDPGAVNPEGASPFRAGNRFHMHNCASGKAILAELSEERIDEIVDRWGLPATTEQTITDRAQLSAELDITRDQGYSINDEELRDGYRSIGATIATPDGSVLGAFSVGGPTYRVSTDEIERKELTQTLLRAVEELERELS